jgi:hypothetical protein
VCNQSIPISNIPDAVDEADFRQEKSFDFICHNVVYIPKSFSPFRQGGWAHGQSRVLLISPDTPKDAERNGGASGNFS